MSDRQVKRYAAYKESGVEWLGELPAHWRIGRLKDFANINPYTHLSNHLKEEDLIEFVPMSNVDEIFGKIKEYNFVPLKQVYSGYTKFRTQDIIFAKITPCMENGNCAIVGELLHGICFGSTEFMVFRARRILKEKYLHYFLHNDLFRRNAEPYMRGTAGQKRISSHYMATHFFSLPPIPEQTAIAAYLDTKTAQIDRQVELLNKKATQYGKLKQSLINETVTRGLDRSAPMKESGVEWIGEVPAHWDVKRLKELFNERSQKGYPKEPLLIASQTHGVTLKSSYLRNTMTVQNDFHLMKLVNKNDFVISLRSFEGGIEISAQRGIISTAYTILTPATNEAARYYKHLFKSTRFIFLLVTCTTGIREGRNVNYQQLKRELLPAPPISEQTAIAAFLDTKTAQIDRIVSTINTQIDKLKELRKTLINDVVTGKIKVIPEGELA